MVFPVWRYLSEKIGIPSGNFYFGPMYVSLSNTIEKECPAVNIKRSLDFETILRAILFIPYKSRKI